MQMQVETEGKIEIEIEVEVKGGEVGKRWRVGRWHLVALALELEALGGLSSASAKQSAKSRIVMQAVRVWMHVLYTRLYLGRGRRVDLQVYDWRFGGWKVYISDGRITGLRT